MKWVIYTDTGVQVGPWAEILPAMEQMDTAGTAYVLGTTEEITK
jgi:hypothetical protein